jgi:hypothetical protein
VIVATPDVMHASKNTTRFAFLTGAILGACASIVGCVLFPSFDSIEGGVGGGRMNASVSGSGTSSGSIGSSSGGGGSDAGVLDDPCLVTGDAGSPLSATFFVAPSGQAPNDGTSWAKAWPDLAAIDWSMINEGSTLCIAAGTYTKLDIQSTGTDTARICIKRAVAGDAPCGTAPGWDAKFDGLVVVPQIDCSGSGFGSYVTIDGRVDGGIKVDDTTMDGTISVNLNGSGANYMRLYRLEVAGVASPMMAFSTAGRALSANYAGGSASGLEVAYCSFHGKPDLIVTAGQHDMVFEHNVLYDAVDKSGTAHVWQSFSNDVNVVIRYNTIYNWIASGILMCRSPGCTPATNWYIYGNVWHDAPTGRVLETQNTAQGPLFLYNNTFANLNEVMGQVANGGSIDGGVATNNLTWKSTTNFMTWNILQTGNSNLTEASGDPFVNSTGADFHLAAGSAPIDQGVPILPAGNGSITFDHDMDGKLRGADGHWDVGAYEH